ncbi:PhzA/PhzB family protein [Actinophytocola sp.]|uniref:PhzA/PhzB family protein n=1 Tax=Actinophytocola sp. TaxID=1872138 RepID=UPI002ED32ADA
MAEEELRRRNRAVVEDYLGRYGENRLTRYLLFTQDGSAGLYTSDTEEPIVSRGHEKLRAHGEWSLRMFPDWRWFNINVFETQDPNWFWAECDGEGKILYPGYDPSFYRNHFLHSFQLDNGRIETQREFMNPFNQLRALGIEVPVIQRGGIPT